MIGFFKSYRLRILFIILGGIAGYLYWSQIGCASGTCPITSNWYTSSGYGVLLGWLLGDSFRVKKGQNEENATN
ncbi:MULTISPECIES: DUF6132 family protein [Prolixibacter]|uniref:DUF6132 family protein n=1 Tax=Prolixibacter TaxID=314318 RepID=UPI000D0E0453|nr:MULTISPECIES: DUF6132 family protein [Prolixibacter]